LIGRQLGGNADLVEQFALRDMAASLLSRITQKYTHASHMLKPRLVRSCLKSFLDPSKPFGAHYGAVIGMQAIGGSEVVRVLIVPNLREYSKLLSDGLDDPARRPAAERVLASLRGKQSLTNGHTVTDDLRARLSDTVGEIIASRILEAGEMQLAHIILEA
jgi:transcription initiation factor TFIID subunit 6